MPGTGTSFRGGSSSRRALLVRSDAQPAQPLFKELAKTGPLPLGQARVTGAGRLGFRGIIHVAGISMWWVSNEPSIRASTRHAIAVADDVGFKSIAFPVIGGGTGGTAVETALGWMVDELAGLKSSMVVTIVRFEPETQ